MLRRAIDMTGGGLREVMRALKPGMYGVRDRGDVPVGVPPRRRRRRAFVSIIGSGPNSTQYHYNANDRRIGKGEVIVMDVGAAFGGYAADVTRTLPANGRFSPEQRAVYQIVRDAQEAAARRWRSRARSFEAWRDAAREVIARGVAKLGLTEGVDATFDPPWAEPVRDQPGRLHPGLPLHGPWARPRHWPRSARSSASLVWDRHLPAGRRVHHRARDLRQPQAAGDPARYAEEPRHDRQGPVRGRSGTTTSASGSRTTTSSPTAAPSGSPARRASSPRSRPRWRGDRELLVLFVTAFVDMVGLTMIVPLLPYYATDFGAGAATVGLLISAFSVAQLAVAPLWGQLSDRYGRRPAILAGLLITAAAYILFAFADSVPALLLTRVVQGVGGGTIGVVQAYVADVSAHRTGAPRASAGSPPSPVSARSPGRRSARSWSRSAGSSSSAWARRRSRSWSRSSPGSSSASRAGIPTPGALAGQADHRPRGDRARALPVARAGAAAHLDLCGRASAPSTAPSRSCRCCSPTGSASPSAPSGYFVMYLGGMGVVVRALVLGRAVDQLGEARLARLGIVILAAGLVATGLAQRRAPRSPRGSRSCRWGRRFSFPASPGCSPPWCRPGSVDCTWACSTPSAACPESPSPSRPGC